MKRRILERYVLGILAVQWLVLFLGVLTIITFGQLPTVLGRAAEHQIAANLVFSVLLRMVVANLPIVLLLTFLLAIVTTMGRLSHDSEFTAMRASGFSPLRLFVLIALFAIPLVVLLSAVTHEYAPRAYCEAVLFRADATRNMLMEGIRPGVFVPLGEHGTLYTQQVSPDGVMHRVFVFNEQAGETGVLTASSGRIHTSGVGYDLALNDGEVHQGIPGERHFRVVKFHDLLQPIILPLDTRACVKPDTRTSSELWGSHAGGDIAELNNRFAQLALAITFLVVGVPLSIVGPRKGAYSRVLPAVCFFTVATFTTTGIANWSARSPVAGSAALWVVLATIFLFGVFWLDRLQRGRRTRKSG